MSTLQNHFMEQMTKADVLIGEALALLNQADSYSVSSIPGDDYKEITDRATHHSHTALQRYVENAKRNLRKEAYAKLRMAREMLA